MICYACGSINYICTFVVSSMLLAGSLHSYFVSCYFVTGLSGEGWYIMKNLCTGLSIVFLGHFTFVPAIQVNYISIF